MRQDVHESLPIIFSTTESLQEYSGLSSRKRCPQSCSNCAGRYVCRLLDANCELLVRIGMSTSSASVMQG